jgi:hypothetical protein
MNYVSKRQRWYAALSFLLLAVIAVLARYFLFSEGILYGEAAAKMASLLVAGIIILGGYLPLRILRGNYSKPDASLDNPGSDAPQEIVAATLAAVLGLALTGYSVSQLLAPNTPVAAAAPACGGTPVYGAHFFATTPQHGVNARRGAGFQYSQLNRYGGHCTLGFDGYCIGPSVNDQLLGTPDQRWLIVHHRPELVAAGVVLSQSAESSLGTTPSPRCKQFGGLPQPNRIKQYSYYRATGLLNANAPGAVAVGYGMASVRQRDRSYQVGTLSTLPGFSAHISPTQIAREMQSRGKVWLGAAICLADGIPVDHSLQVKLIVFHGNHTISQSIAAVPPAVRSLLAETACDST